MMTDVLRNSRDDDAAAVVGEDGDEERVLRLSSDVPVVTVAESECSADGGEVA